MQVFYPLFYITANLFRSINDEFFLRGHRFCVGLLLQDAFTLRSGLFNPWNIACPLLHMKRFANPSTIMILEQLKQLNNVNKDGFYNDGNVLVRQFANDKCVYKFIAQVLRTIWREVKFLNVWNSWCQHQDGLQAPEKRRRDLYQNWADLSHPQSEHNIVSQSRKWTAVHLDLHNIVRRDLTIIRSKCRRKVIGSLAEGPIAKTIWIISELMS